MASYARTDQDVRLRRLVGSRHRHHEPDADVHRRQRKRVDLPQRQRPHRSEPERDAAHARPRSTRRRSARPASSRWMARSTPSRSSCQVWRSQGWARTTCCMSRPSMTAFMPWTPPGGGVLWHASMLGSGETTSDARGCSQVTPEIGITSTPVIDRSRGANGTIYVVAMSRNGSGAYFQRLHALDVTSGAELLGGPRDDCGVVSGNWRRQLGRFRHLRCEAI